MAGARVLQRAGAQIDDEIGDGDEAAAVEMAGDDAVRLDEQIARRAVELAERQHDALELRHVERGRRALAGHVGDEDAER